MVQSQPGQIVHKTISQKKSQKWAGGVAQGAGPEFKLQYLKKKIEKQLAETESVPDI
jgi:hypothetical protein